MARRCGRPGPEACLLAWRGFGSFEPGTNFRGWFLRIISALPEEYRVVAALYFVEDLSYQEIAGIAAIPIGTVRSRLFRARRRLQAALWEAALELGLVTEPEE